MKLWKRSWRVVVGTLDLSELDLTFKVKRTAAPRAGTAEIVIFNPSPASRNELRGLRRGLVRVEAGYEEGRSLIFQGDSRKVDLTREGEDWKVKITAGDGEYAIRTARVARSFGPNARLEDVVRALAETLGLGLGNALAALQGASLGTTGQTFPEGVVLHGTASQELTRLCSSARLEWSCQDGNLQLLPAGQPVTQTAVLLRDDTGLVDTPEPGRHGTVQATALIQPDLLPGRLVRLESETLTGTYRIETVEYNGDTKAGSSDWTAKLVMRLPRS